MQLLASESGFWLTDLHFLIYSIQFRFLLCQCYVKFYSIKIQIQTDTTVHIYNSTAVLILIVSIGSIIISFFGCCGAYKESRCMVGTV